MFHQNISKLSNANISSTKGPIFNAENSNTSTIIRKNILNFFEIQTNGPNIQHCTGYLNFLKKKYLQSLKSHNSTYLKCISVKFSVSYRYGRFGLPEHAPSDRIEF